jgi:uncharacterized membrane protein
MQPRLLKFLDTIRSSYWFIPTLMAVAALLMGAGMVYLDVHIGSDGLADRDWYQANTPDGAREVLSTIAGSAITVAGVVFSITIVAVSFAAGHYGPRVLSNFMRDRGNQITLGTFIATFLYCIIVLRTIRGGSDDTSEFVPDLAVLVALVLALCSIAVLIFFIHHIPNSIHANTVVAKIGRQLIEAFGRLYPEFIGEGEDTNKKTGRAPRVPDALGGDEGAITGDAAEAVAIRSPRTGYIETVEDKRLMETASEHDLVLRLDRRPGEFIHQGRVFARAWPRERVSEQAIAAIEDAFSVGSQRTPLQDTRFLIDELVEVGARALSAGINDPFTAIACLDWLGAGLSELARRTIPSPLRTDEEGVLRVVASPLDYAGYVQLAFGQFRQYLAGDSIAAAHALKVIDTVAADCTDLVRIAALRAEAAALRSLSEKELGDALSATMETERGQGLPR